MSPLLHFVDEDWCFAHIPDPQTLLQHLQNPVVKFPVRKRPVWVIEANDCDRNIGCMLHEGSHILQNIRNVQIASNQTYRSWLQLFSIETVPPLKQLLNMPFRLNDHDQLSQIRCVADSVQVPLYESVEQEICPTHSDTYGAFGRWFMKIIECRLVHVEIGPYDWNLDFQLF